MQIALTPTSAAEVRLVAAFMQDLADLIELQAESVPEVPAEPVEEAPAPAKKSRKKSAPAAEEPTLAASPVSEPDPEPTVTAAEEPEESEAGSADAASEVEVTHDLLRNLYGQLVQNGKRDAAVAAVKSFGVKAIKDIPVEKLHEVHIAMRAVA